MAGNGIPAKVANRALMNYWRGKRAVVTGGSAGLGRALAEALVKQGARVLLVARGLPQLDAAAQVLAAFGGEVLTVSADVTKQDEIDRLAAKVHSAWGGLDALFHCAGRSMRGTALATSAEDFRALWESNFLSAVRCVQAFANSLAENRGHVVLIGSLASKVATSYLARIRRASFRWRRSRSSCGSKTSKPVCMLCSSVPGRLRAMTIPPTWRGTAIKRQKCRRRRIARAAARRCGPSILISLLIKFCVHANGVKRNWSCPGPLDSSLRPDNYHRGWAIGCCGR